MSATFRNPTRPDVVVRIGRFGKGSLQMQITRANGAGLSCSTSPLSKESEGVVRLALALGGFSEMNDDAPGFSNEVNFVGARRPIQPADPK